MFNNSLKESSDANNWLSIELKDKLFTSDPFNLSDIEVLDSEVAATYTFKFIGLDVILISLWIRLTTGTKRAPGAD